MDILQFSNEYKKDLKKGYLHWKISQNKCPSFDNYKGQIMSECIYEIIDFPKYHRKNLPDFCPENLFRLGLLCTHLFSCLENNENKLHVHT